MWIELLSVNGSYLENIASYIKYPEARNLCYRPRPNMWIELLSVNRALETIQIIFYIFFIRTNRSPWKIANPNIVPITFIFKQNPKRIKDSEVTQQIHFKKPPT